jgi:hypothetical protein
VTDGAGDGDLGADLGGGGGGGGSMYDLDTKGLIQARRRGNIAHKAGNWSCNTRIIK